jgi:5-methylcytosine-specific restriction endonuclease McrA
MRHINMPKKKPLIPKSKIISALRRLWLYQGTRALAIKEAKEGDFYRCKKCSRLSEKVSVDHTVPVIDTVLGWQGYDSFVERLFCPQENLMALCDRCHSTKTSAEASSRKESRAKLKEKKQDE